TLLGKRFWEALVRTANASITEGPASKDLQEMEDVAAVRPARIRGESFHGRGFRAGVGLEHENAFRRENPADTGEAGHLPRARPVGTVGEHDLEALSPACEILHRPRGVGADDGDLTSRTESFARAPERLGCRLDQDRSSGAARDRLESHRARAREEIQKPGSE